MAVEHVDIAEAELHELKGASTALAGKVPAADGAGSTVFTYLPHGWGNYVDTGSGNQVISSTRLKLQLDGATVIETFLPRAIRGTGSLWNGTTDYITPIAIGDAYNARLDLPFTASSGTPTRLTFELDISAQTPPTNVILADEIEISKTAPYTLSINFTFFSLATFIANGGAIWLTVNTGTLTFLNPDLTIFQVSGDV